MAGSTARGGVGPGNRRSGAAAGRRAARSSERSLSATRRPGRSSRPPAGRTPEPAAGPQRRSSPRAGERRRAIAAVRSPLARQIVALGLALCAVALSLAYPLRGYLQQQAAEAQAVAEQQQLEAEIADREAQITALKDPAYIRSEAKRRLQYVTPGDTVYVVKAPDSGSEPGSGDGPVTGSVGGLLPSVAGADDAAATSAAAGGGAAAGGSAATGAAPDGPWYTSLWDTLTGGGH